jgi:hypothetical protein
MFHVKHFRRLFAGKSFALAQPTNSWLDKGCTNVHTDLTRFAVSGFQWDQPPQVREAWRCDCRDRGYLSATGGGFS